MLYYQRVLKLAHRLKLTVLLFFWAITLIAKAILHSSPPDEIFFINPISDLGLVCILNITLSIPLSFASQFSQKVLNLAFSSFNGTSSLLISWSSFIAWAFLKL